MYVEALRVEMAIVEIFQTRLKDVPGKYVNNKIQHFYRTCQTGDPHTALAALVYDVAPADVTRRQRHAVKEAMFMSLYSTPSSDLVDIMAAKAVEPDEAAKTRDAFRAAYPRLAALFAEEAR